MRRRIQFMQKPQKICLIAISLSAYIKAITIRLLSFATIEPTYSIREQLRKFSDFYNNKI
jgi:hypothetical protein